MKLPEGFDLALARQLWHEGYTAEAIGARLTAATGRRVQAVTVYRIARVHDWPSRRGMKLGADGVLVDRRRTPEQRRQARGSRAKPASGQIVRVRCPHCGAPYTCALGRPICCVGCRREHPDGHSQDRGASRPRGHHG